MSYSISFFSPVYNEEDNVGELINEANNILSEITDDYEVIIVNDGSTDKTEKIVDDLAREGKALHIKHSINRGYGEALISGFKKAKKDLIFFTDGDLQFDISEIKKFIDRIEENSVVIGYRKNRQDNFVRKINTWFWKQLVKYMYGLNVKDIDCAFKLFKKEALNDINLGSSGAVVSTELLIKLKNKGYKLIELPVSHYPRKSGKASGANLRVILKAFKELFLLKNELSKNIKK